MDAKISVRPLRKEERYTALALIHHSIRVLTTKEYNPHQVECIVRLYNPSFFVTGVVLAAELDQTLVGVAKADIWLDTQHVQAVFTHPDFVRCGVGTSLMHEIERAAQLKRVRKISISASLSAIDFYKCLGYDYLGESYLNKDIAVGMMMKTLRSSIFSKMVSNHRIADALESAFWLFLIIVALWVLWIILGTVVVWILQIIF